MYSKSLEWKKWKIKNNWRMNFKYWWRCWWWSNFFYFSNKQKWRKKTNYKFIILLFFSSYSLLYNSLLHCCTDLRAKVNLRRTFIYFNNIICIFFLSLFTNICFDTYLWILWIFFWIAFLSLFLSSFQLFLFLIAV